MSLISNPPIKERLAVDLGPEHIEHAAELLAAMSNPQRLSVLKLLATREMSVNELNSHVSLSQSALSQHLAVLRDTDLVDTRRQGQAIFYSVSSPFALRILAALDKLFPPEIKTKQRRAP